MGMGGKGRRQRDKSQSKMLQKGCSILANLGEKYRGFNVLFFQLSCRFENLKKKKRKERQSTTILYLAGHAQFLS